MRITPENTSQTESVYLDHAATTPLDSEILERMLPYLQERYANPSALYPTSSRVKSDVEKARREIKEMLKGPDGNLFFTSGGTEANNWAISGVVRAYGIRHIITSPLEHSSVLAPIRAWKKQGISVSWVQLKEKGKIDYTSLESLLRKYPQSLVSLMHGNNEIGNLTDIARVSALCKRYDSIFHSDLVQTVGYYPIDVAALGIDLCTASAHKFYGPKGIGFLYTAEGFRIDPLIYGGQQEKGLRGGTENVAGIVGMRYALRKRQNELSAARAYVESLKRHMIETLKKKIPHILFHGQCQNMEESVCTILNLGLPKADQETLIMQLALHRIYASSGSACMSGGQSTSHVLEALGIQANQSNVRLSLGIHNTIEDMEYTVKALEKMIL